MSSTDNVGASYQTLKLPRPVSHVQLNMLLSPDFIGLAFATKTHSRLAAAAAQDANTMVLPLQ